MSGTDGDHSCTTRALCEASRALPKPMPSPSQAPAEKPQHLMENRLDSVAQHKPRKTIAAYVLVSHGPRSYTHPGHSRGGRAQWKSFQELRRKHGLLPRPVVHDYARQVRTLDDLPALKAYLENCAVNGGPAIWIDGVGRILSRAELEHRNDLLDELRAYGAHILDFRAGRLLSKFEEGRLRLLFIMAKAPRHPSPSLRIESEPARKRRRSQTRAAVAASSAARSRSADKRAWEIEMIRDDLAAKGQRSRPADVAREANDRGFRSARGKPWTSTAVSLALKRLAALASPEGE